MGQDGKADDNLKVGNDTSKDSSGKDSGSSSTPKAKSGENGGTTVTVAAAVSIAIITARALATLDAGTTLTTTGAVSLTTTEDVDSKAIAKASAVKAKTANIGAAVAINLVKVFNQATPWNDRGTWSSGGDYGLHDVVTDHSNGNQYMALHGLANDTVAPHSDPTNWAAATSAIISSHGLSLSAGVNKSGADKGIWSSGTSSYRACPPPGYFAT